MHAAKGSWYLTWFEATLVWKVLNVAHETTVHDRTFGHSETKTLDLYDIIFEDRCVAVI